ncbi:MAG TPA: DUF971 domain-containing protein [Planctomycetota bacterium]|nr:DUF971 domain-containing protein [Planctomycetota bacterium]
MSSVHPVDARLPRPDLLEISWSDGRTLVYPTPFLRAQCPCAGCVDEWTGEVKVNESMFRDVVLRALRQVGQYAFALQYSDGHNTGIYTYPRLLALGRAPDQPEAPGT